MANDWGYDADRPDVWTWLQAWYVLQCDGDWEHSEGILFESLDNPGWHIRIPIEETELRNLPFDSTSTALKTTGALRPSRTACLTPTAGRPTWQRHFTCSELGRRRRRRNGVARAQASHAALAGARRLHAAGHRAIVIGDSRWSVGRRYSPTVTASALAILFHCDSSSDITSHTRRCSTHLASTCLGAIGDAWGRPLLLGGPGRSAPAGWGDRAVSSKSGKRRHPNASR
jgi:hypothetical protein